MAEPQLDGCIQLYIAVPPQEMKRWSAAAISQFFDGLAQIVFAAGNAAHVEIVRTENTDDHQPVNYNYRSTGTKT